MRVARVIGWLIVGMLFLGCSTPRYQTRGEVKVVTVVETLPYGGEYIAVGIQCSSWSDIIHLCANDHWKELFIQEETFSELQWEIEEILDERVGEYFGR